LKVLDVIDRRGPRALSLPHDSPQVADGEQEGALSTMEIFTGNLASAPRKDEVHGYLLVSEVQ
jgi:hypothetical protein